MNGIIYKAKNKINGKVYIGQTSRSLAIRIKEHKLVAKNHKSNSPFHSAIRKYGFRAFDWEVISTCKQGKKLDRLEIKAIKEYNSVHRNYGYNITKGGNVLRGKNNPFYGKYHSEETKQKISKINKGRPSSKRGIKMSEETRQKLIKSIQAAGGNKGKYNPMYGKTHSEKIKKLISEKHMGKSVPDKYLKHLICDWLIIFPDGHKKIISNLKRFCRHNNLNQGMMSLVAQGKYKLHKGYGCKKIYKFNIKMVKNNG